MKDFALKILQALLNLGALSISYSLHKLKIIAFHFSEFLNNVPPIQIVSSSGCATTTRTFFFMMFLLYIFIVRLSIGPNLTMPVTICTFIGLFNHISFS